MSIEYPCKIAAAHVASVWLDLERTLAKTCDLIHEAARQGARLIVFPEAFIPAFPVWSALRAPIYNHDLFQQLVTNSLYLDGPQLSCVCQAAAEAEINVSLGFNERSRDSVGCLYNSNLLIGPHGSILNHHRKLMPTFYEKLSWAAGDGSGLRVIDTTCGRVGMLICGENTNPLARYAMIAQGEQVHVSSYPPIWPSHPPEAAGEYDLAAAIRLRAGAHSFEAKAFNVVCSGFMDSVMFEFLSGLHADAAAILEASPRGVSLVTSPSGKRIGDEMSDSEGLLYAELDLNACVEPKQFHDISGGYNRFDVFQLTINRTPHRPVHYTENGSQWQPLSSTRNAQESRDGSDSDG